MMFQFPLQRKWVPDSESYKCFTCKSEFGIFVGRHHCRVCGRIFCKKCTLWASLPVSWILKNVRTETTTATAWLPWLPWHWEEKENINRSVCSAKNFTTMYFEKNVKFKWNNVKSCFCVFLLLFGPPACLSLKLGIDAFPKDFVFFVRFHIAPQYPKMFGPSFGIIDKLLFLRPSFSSFF